MNKSHTEKSQHKGQLIQEILSPEAISLSFFQNQETCQNALRVTQPDLNSEHQSTDKSELVCGKREEPF